MLELVLDARSWTSSIVERMIDPPPPPPAPNAASEARRRLRRYCHDPGSAFQLCGPQQPSNLARCPYLAGPDHCRSSYHPLSVVLLSPRERR